MTLKYIAKYFLQSLFRDPDAGEPPSLEWIFLAPEALRWRCLETFRRSGRHWRHISRHLCRHRLHFRQVTLRWRPLMLLEDTGDSPVVFFLSFLSLCKLWEWQFQSSQPFVPRPDFSLGQLVQVAARNLSIMSLIYQTSVGSVRDMMLVDWLSAGTIGPKLRSKCSSQAFLLVVRFSRGKLCA